MKIINNENNILCVYIQKKNLKDILKYEKDIPNNLLKLIKDLELKEDDNSHDEEFIRMEGEEFTNYINSLQWIPDYKKLRDLPDQDIEILINEETKNIAILYSNYISMSKSKQDQNKSIQLEWQKKESTIKDLYALLWTRQNVSKTPIEIPLAIDTDMVHIETGRIGYLAGLSFDKKKILFTKTNNEPFNDDDRLSPLVMNNIIMVIGIEENLTDMEEGVCQLTSYLDPTGMYFVNEFKFVDTKTNNTQTTEQESKPKNKSRLRQAFNKIRKPSNKDAE